MTCQKYRFGCFTEITDMTTMALLIIEQDPLDDLSIVEVFTALAVITEITTIKPVNLEEDPIY